MPLHKDGDNEEVGSYGAIALVCSMAKVFMRVLARRMRRFAEDKILMDAQGGFRNRRCSDQWLVLGVCEFGRVRIKHTWSSWMLARHMTVCGWIVV